jgi:hypothetical protein
MSSVPSSHGTSGTRVWFEWATEGDDSTAMLCVQSCDDEDEDMMKKTHRFVMGVSSMSMVEETVDDGTSKKGHSISAHAVHSEATLDMWRFALDVWRARVTDVIRTQGWKDTVFIRPRPRCWTLKHDVDVHVPVVWRYAWPARLKAKTLTDRIPWDASPELWDARMAWRLCIMTWMAAVRSTTSLPWPKSARRAALAVWIPQQWMKCVLPLLPCLCVPLCAVSVGDFHTPTRAVGASCRMRILQHPMLAAWLTTNADVPAHPKLIGVPLGMSVHLNRERQGELASNHGRFRDEEVLADVHPPSSTMPWSERQRRVVWDSATYDKEGTMRDMRARIRYHARLPKNASCVTLPPALPRSKLWQEVYAKHAFVASPPGCGWDCYRHYETLHCGAVPIMTRAAPETDPEGFSAWAWDPAWDTVPVVWVEEDEWSRVFTKEWIDDAHERIRSKWFATPEACRATQQAIQLFLSASAWMQRIRAQLEARQVALCI